MAKKIAAKGRTSSVDTDPVPPDLRHTVEFVRYTMSDIIVRGEYQDWGLFRIVNRFAFLAVRNLVFIIFVEDGGNYIFRHHVSVFDPLFDDKLYQTLQELRVDEEDETSPRLAFEKSEGNVARFDADEGARKQTPSLVLSDAAIERYGIRILGSHAHTIVLELLVDEDGLPPEPPGREPRLGFRPVEKGSPLGAFIEAVLEDFDGGSSGQRKRLEIKRRESNREIDALMRASAVRRSLNVEPENQDFPEADQQLVKELSLRAQDIVHAEYSRYTLSPVLKSFLEEERGAVSDRKMPINAFFFSKVFSRTTTRYGEYYYDTMLVISPEQREHIRNGLSLALENRRKFLPFSAEREGDYNKPPDAAADLNAAQRADEAFWSTVRSEAGQNAIIDALIEPPSSDLRLFPENALMSGASMVKPGVFSRGALAWLKRPEDSAIKDASEREAIHGREWFRMACLHYVLQLSSPCPPVEAGERLSVVTLPMRCSGGIWLAGAYLRVNNELEINDNPPIGSGLLDKDDFERNYLIYHSLFRETERRLRRRAKRKFLAEVGRLFLAAAKHAGDEARDRGNQPLTVSLGQERLDVINHGLLCLSRLYPFPLFSVELVRGSLVIREHENPFYDRLTTVNFLPFEELQSQIRRYLAMGLAGMSVDSV